MRAIKINGKEATPTEILLVKYLLRKLTIRIEYLTSFAYPTYEVAYRLTLDDFHIDVPVPRSARVEIRDGLDVVNLIDLWEEYVHKVKAAHHCEMCGGTH